MSKEQKELDDIDLLKKDLTAGELKFCNFYLGAANFNATRAAKLAGYKGNSNTLASLAWKMLRKDHIKAYIDAVYDEIAMPANEILARLATIARCSIEDVLSEKEMFFDEAKARENGAIHAVKKFKIERTVKLTKTEVAGDQPEAPFNLFEDDPRLDQSNQEIALEKKEILFEKVEFEMHDQLAALDKLGKHHKLFTDKIDATLETNNAEVIFYIPDNNRDKKE